MKKTLFSQINMHERQFDEQGVLTYHYQWLVLINGSKDFDYLEIFVGNITHLSIFVWQKEASKHSEKKTQQTLIT